MSDTYKENENAGADEIYDTSGAAISSRSTRSPEDDDRIDGTDGDDVLDGGIGNDVIRGYGGNDTLYGGDGTDTASYANSDSGVTIFLSGGTTIGGGCYWGHAV